MRRGRENKGLTQAQIANALGKTRSLVSLWEADSLIPSVDDQERLSQILDIDQEELRAAFQRTKALRALQVVISSGLDLLTIIGEFLNVKRLPSLVAELIAEVSRPKWFELSTVLLPKLGPEFRLLYPLNEAVRAQEQLEFFWEEPKELTADGYRLTVYDLEGLNVLASWEAESSPSRYLSELPPLEGGKDYGWYVEVLKGGEPMIRSDPARFRLLSQTERERLEEEEERWKVIEAELDLIAGALYESLGLYQEAEQRYKALMARDDPRGYARLGRIYEQKGLVGQARECYERANALWSQEEEVKEHA